MCMDDKENTQHQDIQSVNNQSSASQEPATDTTAHGVGGGAASQESATAAHAGMSTGYYWFFILFMVGLSMFGSFVNSMYIPALPAMAREFHCTPSVAQLGFAFGMIGLGVGQMILGPISDKYGRKRVLGIGIGVFVVGGIASVFSPTMQFFIGCRLVQGLGASSGYFLARTIPADVASGRALAKMMALIGAINGIAPASAPVLGGVIAHLWGWRTIFIVLTLFAVIMWWVSRYLRETLAPERRAQGSMTEIFKGYIVLMKRHKYLTHVMLKGSALGMLFAYISSGPFIVQTHYGYSQVAFGLFMGFNALFVMSGSMLALKFRPLRCAGVVGAIGMIPTVGMMAIALFLDWPFWVYEVSCCAMLVCMGMIFTMSNSLAMNEGRDDAGRASALLGFFGYVFGAVASPLVGMGNVMHSTAVISLILLAMILLFAWKSYRIAPELMGQ